LLLRQNEAVTAGQIAEPQQTTCEAAFNRVHSIASYCLLSLCQHGLPVTHQGFAQMRALATCRPEPADVQYRGNAWNEDDRFAKRKRVAKRGKRPQHAIATDHSDFDPLAAQQLYDKRDDATVGHENVFERMANLNQDARPVEVRNKKMRTDQFELVVGQGREEAVC
jgi:hypothetical protein